MSTVDLRYSGLTPITINLCHDEVCCRAGRCLCTNGRWASVHLIPGVWQRGLSDAVLHSATLARLIATKQVRVRTLSAKNCSVAAETTNEPQTPRRRRVTKE